MIKGLFKLQADRQRIAGLSNSPDFRFYVDKLRGAYTKAVADTLNCSSENLPERRAYARCLSELIEETTKPYSPGGTP